MIFAVARLATEARILTVPVAMKEKDRKVNSFSCVCVFIILHTSSDTCTSQLPALDRKLDAQIGRLRISDWRKKSIGRFYLL